MSWRGTALPFRGARKLRLRYHMRWRDCFSGVLPGDSDLLYVSEDLPLAYRNRRATT
jgi:hypothetical protein